MDYQLGENQNDGFKVGVRASLKTLYRFARNSRLQIVVAFISLLVGSLTVIIAPAITGDITNKYIPASDRDGLLSSLIVLAAVYIIGSLANYIQIRTMGKVGQAILFNIRTAVFNKLQELPLQFFNQNKSGDLISRINNDTDKMSQAFSETLLRFTGDIVVIIGVAITMLLVNVELGMIAIVTLVIMVFITSLISGWIKSRNDRSLQKLGELAGEIQESLSNFKVTVVFNRRDYFRQSFAQVNDQNRRAATWAGIANGVLAPFYNYAGTIASGVILIVGIQIFLIDRLATGQTPEFGTLLSFILYSNAFFSPLREMGDLFSQLQVAIASWSRIFRLLSLRTNLPVIDDEAEVSGEQIVKFHNVSFGYNKENMILKGINLDLEKGKTYALVGPTGGGKSTTASLMMRLYDPTEGVVYLNGRDIRSYQPEELSLQIGFILQEPFLFGGTLAQNIVYANPHLADSSVDELEKRLVAMGLEKLIQRFSDGLETVINPGAENISLGQRQLISFVRALLREPKLLILDEATANIDTVTENLLEQILQSLPKDTTKVIIAHRLNTIESADQIFFISGGTIEKPVDFKSAMTLISQGNRKS